VVRSAATTTCPAGRSTRDVTHSRVLSAAANRRAPTTTDTSTSSTPMSRRVSRHRRRPSRRAGGEGGTAVVGRAGAGASSVTVHPAAWRSPAEPVSAGTRTAAVLAKDAAS
jgi:hypothetical protein